MAPSNQELPLVYLLHLDDAGAPDVGGGIINLPAPVKPYVLRFAIQGASSICREGTLWINVPEDGKAFEREKFRAVPLVSLFSIVNMAA
jgi:glycogen debranching enzyme